MSVLRLKEFSVIMTPGYINCFIKERYKTNKMQTNKEQDMHYVYWVSVRNNNSCIMPFKISLYCSLTFLDAVKLYSFVSIRLFVS